MCEADDTSGTPVAGTSGHPIEVRSDTVELIVVARDQAGGALAGVTVQLTESGASAGSATTDEFGRASFRVTRGRVIEVRAGYDVGRATDATAAHRRAFQRAQDALTPTADPSYATLFLPRPQPLTNRFSWQNEVIRRTIYRDDGENDDPGQDAPAGGGRRRGRSATPLHDRKDRLIEICRFVSEFMPHSPAAPGGDSERLRHARGVSETATSRTAETQRDLDAVEREDSELRTELAGLPYGRSTRDRRTVIVARRRELRDERTQLRAELRRRSEAQGDADAEVAGAEAEAVGRLSHDELIAYIVGPLFGADPGQTYLPPWVRYCILHLTGFRYAIAHRSYYPPAWLAFNLRSFQIEQLESRLTASQLDSTIGEMRALFASKPGLADAVAAQLEWFVAGRDRVVVNRVRRLRPRGRNRFDVGALLDAGAENRAPRGADARYRRNAKLACVSDVLKALGFVETNLTSVAEAMGLLVHQRIEGVLRSQDDKWAAAVKYTHLRNDEARSDSWRDPECRRFPEPWRSIFGDDVQRAWARVQAEDLSMTVLSCECNEVAEMAAAARGVSVGGRGIRGDAATLSTGAAGVDDEEDEDEEETEPNTEEPGSPVGEHASGHRLFRIASAGDIQPGDVLFHINWSAIPSRANADPGKCVTPGLDMEYQLEDEVIDPGGLPLVTETELQRGTGDPPAGGGGLRYARAPCKPGSAVLMIVRRSNASFTKYDEYLRFVHIFTAVHARGSHVYTFETNAPVGMRKQNLSRFQSWEYVAARPASPDAASSASLTRKLAPFLDPALLIPRRPR